MEVHDHELLRRIGGGSYGEVWLARNVQGKYRAVKIVRRADSSEERPFNCEFEGVRRYEPVSREHEGLVDILQVGRDDAAGYFYYVMELADDASGSPSIEPERYVAKTLRGLLQPGSLRGGANVPAANAEQAEEEVCAAGCRDSSREGERFHAQSRERSERIPPQHCIEIAVALVSAIAHLHQCKLVHRDIKPANIIFVNGQPKLADIGLVAGAGEECSFVGTEGYVAPEGPGRVQADIFAIGKVLYQMETGLRLEQYPKVPDEWATAPERLELQELNEVVLRACEGKSKRRYATAEKMLSELRLLQNNESPIMLSC